MKSLLKLPFIILCIFPVLLLGQLEKKVLLIGIDGVRPDALEYANTPYLDDLKVNGIYSPDAMNDDITISGPGWSAILCGVWSDKHGVTGNDFTNDNYDNFPPFFDYIETFNSDLKTASICHWGPINDFIVQDFSDYTLNVSSDEDVSLEAFSYLSQENPDVLFLHYDDVDHAGHANGFSIDVPEYVSAIEQVDTYIGIVLAGIESGDNYENEEWLILVTTDHGGIGFSHGGNTIDEKQVFLIANRSDLETTIISKDSSIVVEEVFNCLEKVEELKFDGENDQMVV